MAKPKTIHCLDKTDGLLFYCISFLEKLDNSLYDVRFSPDPRCDYGDLFSLFEKITLVAAEKREASDLRIEFVSQHSQPDDSAHLVYPVFESDWEKFDTPDSRRMPLYRQNVPVRPDDGDAMDMIIRYLEKQDLRGKKVLVNAGPSLEDIDPVRFISNRSSGKMGIALARAAWRRGANVRLIAGPVAHYVPQYLNHVTVRSAAEMAGAVNDHFAQCDYFFAAAAVADYTPASVSEQKMKKGDGDMSLPLKRTSDILLSIKDKKRDDQIIVGFSVETENVRDNSTQKMKKKGLDFICINNPKEEGAGFAHNTNRIDILSKDGAYQSLPVLSKLETADRIIDAVLGKAAG